MSGHLQPPVVKYERGHGVLHTKENPPYAGSICCSLTVPLIRRLLGESLVVSGLVLANYLHVRSATRHVATWIWQAKLSLLMR